MRFRPPLLKEPIMAGMGDLKTAEAQQYKILHARILDACHAAYQAERNKSACNFFVQDVARRLGITSGVEGKANDIYASIEAGSPWINCGEGEAGSVAAAYYALQGFFVVAAWEDTEGGTGHVAVVAALDFSAIPKGRSPTSFHVLASWGMKDRPQNAKHLGGIRYTFSPSEKLPDVIFGAQFIQKFA
jgi:hypothetical protein